MKFLVICRAIEPPPVGYPDQLELLDATQQRLAGGDDRIVATYSFAGERAFAMVIEAETGRELAGAVFGLPAEPATGTVTVAGSADGGAMRGDRGNRERILPSADRTCPQPFVGCSP